MTEDQIRSMIIEDLLKIDRYKSPLDDNSTRKDIYQSFSLEELKTIHQVIVTYLIDYRTLGDPYPSIIEKLTYTNDEIETCIKNYKYQQKEEQKKRDRMGYGNTRLDQEHEQDIYCDACQQAPCMCSDREASSTVHDF